MADFAAAQKRIQERREARAAALSAAEQSHRHHRAARLAALPPPVRSYGGHVLALWDAVQSPYGTRPAFRVGQVDAELLDEALMGLLKKQAAEGLKFWGAHLKDDYDAELSTALRAVMWKLSIYDHGQSYGASLQGLKYIDARGDPDPNFTRREATRWQRILYGLITVGGRYGWTRWEECLAALENGYDEPSPLVRRLSRLTTFASTSHNIAAFVSFLVFLYNGRYRTLTDRLLRLRLVPASNQTSREVSFEWLNRQLVWHAFTEFLLFILPLVGISRWRRWLSRAWKKTKSTATRLFSTKSTYDDDDEDDIRKGELAFLPERTCAICYQDQNPAGGQSEQDILASSVAANSGIIGSSTTDITNPYETIPCACIYCFVCLAQRIEAEEGEGFICLRCGETVQECRPWNGDVLVERTRSRRLTQSSTGAGSRPPSRRKSVMFDLDREKREMEEAEEEEDEVPLNTVDPMPMEDSQAWNEVNEGDDDEYQDGDEEGDGGSEDDDDDV